MSLPAQAAGDDVEERRMQADALYEQGLKLEGTEPKAALVALRSSYEIHASVRVLYKIGRVCMKLGDKACAARSFEQYLKDGRSEVSAKRRKEVESELRTIALEISAPTLTITSKVDGAFVKVDGTVVGRTPLAEPIRVRTGEHKIVLVADGHVIEKTVNVTSSEEIALDPSEDQPPAPAAAPAPEPRPAPEPPRSEVSAGPGRATLLKQPAILVPWVAAGALATGTVVTSLLMYSARSDYEAVRNEYPLSRESLEDAHGSARDLLILTSVLGVATAVSVGVASYLTFGRGDAKPRAKAVDVALGPGGIGISGRWP